MEKKIKIDTDVCLAGGLSFYSGAEILKRHNSLLIRYNNIMARISGKKTASIIWSALCRLNDGYTKMRFNEWIKFYHSDIILLNHNFCQEEILYQDFLQQLERSIILFCPTKNS